MKHTEQTVADSRIAGLAERLLGDERLSAALPDRAATALTTWALTQLRALDPAADDAALEDGYAAVRAALLAAAQSGVKTPKRLIARAAAALRTTGAPPAIPPSKPDETIPQRNKELTDTKTGNSPPALDAAALDMLTRALDGGPDKTAHDGE